MKKNRTILIIVLLLVVIAAGLYLTNSSSTLRKGESDFAIEDTALITKIFLADKNNNEITLIRDTSGAWLVNGQLAQAEKVRAFLKTLQDIKVRNPVPLVARNNVITRMATLAKKVEIYQVKPRIDLFGLKLFPHKKLVKTYYVGDVTPDNQGTFMLMEGSEAPFVVSIPGFRGFVASRYSTLDYEWRDYSVFRSDIGDIKSVEVEFPEDPKESYELQVDDSRNVRLISLADQQQVAPFDTIRVLNFLTAFHDVRFEALLNNQIDQHVIDSVLTTTPKTIITLASNDGKVNEVKIYPKKGFSQLYDEDGAALEPMDLDRAYALVNGGQDFVLIQYFVFDKVTRPLGYLEGREN